jgi:hypothetical protein
MPRNSSSGFPVKIIGSSGISSIHATHDVNIARKRLNKKILSFRVFISCPALCLSYLYAPGVFSSPGHPFPVHAFTLGPPPGSGLCPPSGRPAEPIARKIVFS